VRRTGGAGASTTGGETGPVPGASAARTAKDVYLICTGINGDGVGARESNRAKLRNKSGSSLYSQGRDNKSESYRHTVTGGTSGRAILVVLLNNNTIVGDACNEHM
jgi:hypothetical protein